MSGEDRPRGYVVECYWPGVSAEQVAAAVERAEQAAGELRSHGRPVRFLGSILIPADETVFCLFDGQEADVRAVSEKAGVPFERVLESLRIGGSGGHQQGGATACSGGRRKLGLSKTRVTDAGWEVHDEASGE